MAPASQWLAPGQMPGSADEPPLGI
jgi:hypothetical protein